MAIADFIKRNLPIDYSIQCIRPLKGNPVYDLCKEKGLIESDYTLDDYVYMWSKYVVVPTENMSKRQIKSTVIYLTIKLILIDPIGTIKKLFAYRYLTVGYVWSFLKDMAIILKK